MYDIFFSQRNDLRHNSYTTTIFTFRSNVFHASSWSLKNQNFLKQTFDSLFLATLCTPPCLLVANTSDIIAVDYRAAVVNSVVSGLSRAVAIDVHFSLGYIFWSDVTEHNIKRLHIQSNSIKTTISGIGVCDGLAVEWRSSKLYWSDTTYDRISISDLDGNNQHTIVSSELEEPRAIALDLDNG